MLNFLPLRSPAVSLLYGKRAVQRISVGGASNALKESTTSTHDVEIPLPVVDYLYDFTQPDLLLHQNTCLPLQWKAFMQLKVDAFYLMEAAQAGDGAAKSALSQLDWYPKLSALYAGQQTLVELDTLEKLGKPKFSYPIQGKSV
ncbi:hypothetical protein IE077_000291 [Cardiosporidium cionae]|uniref:Uncharacterized protein n=1 Tax=Cardiosporidium cionae TaxID=476202 RepID=A0ABQ7JBK0_9APIC|nr:hypothetical protein IE077_000291 [Cardiosporidium cionae]|eukprot:KAF8821377.1 hypothetical protein IE077_000291 [Cardiosporidium cionae]